MNLPPAGVVPHSSQNGPSGSVWPSTGHEHRVADRGRVGEEEELDQAREGAGRHRGREIVARRTEESDRPERVRILDRQRERAERSAGVADEGTVVAVPARTEVPIDVADDVARDMAAIIADDFRAGEPVVGERVHAADADENGLVDCVAGDEPIRDLLHVKPETDHLRAAGCHAVRRAVRGEVPVITPQAGQQVDDRIAAMPVRRGMVAGWQIDQDFSIERLGELIPAEGPSEHRPLDEHTRLHRPRGGRALFLDRSPTTQERATYQPSGRSHDPPRLV